MLALQGWGWGKVREEEKQLDREQRRGKKTISQRGRKDQWTREQMHFLPVNQRKANSSHKEKLSSASGIGKRK